MLDKLQDLIGVLLILGLLLLLKRVLDSLFLRQPPTRHKRTRSVPREIQKSPTD